MSLDLKRVVEGLLFVAEGPLNVVQLARVLDESDKAKIQTALDDLTKEYEDLGRAFELVEVAGGYRLRTRPQLAPWLRRLKNQQTTRLSRAALESLAIIAYRQPVLKAEIERIRGVEVGGVLRMLMEKDLVKVVGRRDLPGRPLIYGTTKRFLEVFDLKDLKDLPTIEEMEALAGEGGLFEGAGGSDDDQTPLFREHPQPREEELAGEEDSPPEADAGDLPEDFSEGEDFSGMDGEDLEPPREDLLGEALEMDQEPDWADSLEKEEEGPDRDPDSGPKPSS